jgi:hypothetical protein
MVMYAKIRRMFFRELLSISEIARRSTLTRNTIKKWLRAADGSDVRDLSFEQQRYRASGLNLITAAIMLWNTVYVERATAALRGNGKALDDTLFQYLSPLGWENINLTGDYLWRSSAKIGVGKFRPLRP